MDVAATNFLRSACAIIQNYDREGRALVPVGAWQLILEDLGLEEDSDATSFLVDHLQASGEFFSYMPLLQALGVGGSGDGRSAPENAAEPPYRPSVGGGRDEAGLGLTLPPSGRRDLGGPEAPEVPRLAGACFQGDVQGDDSPSQFIQPGLYDRTMDQMYAMQAPSHRIDEDEQLDLEDEEDYWASRAPLIQNLYKLWDCNQFSNETFMVRLQELLGGRIDVSSKDSAFCILTNKHRSARNLKFSELMSALRKDARATSRGGGKRSPGGSLMLSQLGSEYGDRSNAPLGRRPNTASVGEQTPSEVGSETPSHAAGRASGRSPQAPPQAASSRGRRHFDQGSSLGGSSVGVPTQPPQRPRSASGAASACSGYSVDDRPPYVCSDPPRAPMPRDAVSTGQRLFGGEPESDRGSGGGYPTGSSILPGGGGVHVGGGLRKEQLEDLDTADLWQPKGQKPGVQPRYRDDDQQSDIASVAESQRSAYSMRNRGGHGNILTWGNDESRAVTPERKKQGKSQLIGEDGNPRSYGNSNVFAHQRS